MIKEATTTRFTPALSEQEAVKQAHMHKALSHPIRLQILSLLREYGGQIHVEKIVECLPLSQPTVSHHLRILYRAGLVDCCVDGLYSYYYLRGETLLRVHEAIATLE